MTPVSPIPLLALALLLAASACAPAARRADASDPGGAAPDAGSGGAADSGAGAEADAGAVEAGALDGGLADGHDGAFEAALFGAGAERRIDAVPVPRDMTTAPACAPGTTSGCLYQPPLASAVTEWVFRDDVSYVDVLGKVRTVPFAVYRAADAPLHAPVVMMSHGGSRGIDDPTEVLREWASIVAGAGYITVAIAHSDYSMDASAGPSEYEQLCAAVGVPQVMGFMCALKVNWQRPLDIAAVEGWLEARVASNAAWSASLDLSRLAHFGHSAGSGAGMMVGGVTRNYRCAQPFGGGQGTIVPCDVNDLVSRRLLPVRAVVAFSPEGPGTDGFMDESFPSLAVPLLMATGREDGDPGEPANRLALFPLLPEGPRWKVYFDHVGAQHGLFGGNLDPCLAQTTAQRCADLRGALTATALAFLDAHLRGRAEGLTWLGSGNLEVVSNGVASLTAR